jgi:hypothetical protein
MTPVATTAPETFNDPVKKGIVWVF